ncbi:MAG TPA: GerMN domain-containing protein [Catenuloplanes sp.]
MRRLRLAILLCAFAFTGCGVPTDDRPREIEPPRGPFPAIASTAPGTPDAGEAAEPLYFVRADKLVPIVRRVHTAPALREQIEHLIAGPTGPERRGGLSSAVNGNLTFAGVSLAAGVATIRVGDGIDESGRRDAVLAYGQIVCTLTTRSDVKSVVFHHDGRRLGIPRADLSLTTDPLTAADYTALTAPA